MHSNEAQRATFFRVMRRIVDAKKRHVNGPSTSMAAAAASTGRETAGTADACEDDDVARRGADAYYDADGTADVPPLQIAMSAIPMVNETGNDEITTTCGVCIWSYLIHTAHSARAQMPAREKWRG